MSAQAAASLGEQIAAQYNPSGLVPFPFEVVLAEHPDLQIYVSSLDLEGDSVSGLVSYDPEQDIYKIVVNEEKPATRRYFTTAHELGHYFLHKEQLRERGLTVDSDTTSDMPNGLYRYDDLLFPIQEEVEANNFAASLIMPENQVREAWQRLRDVEACADVFNVSVEAMGIRLVRLGILR